eukprot:scaffold218156_cov30-Tisochrysis_lutea.AAC.4
MTQYRSTGHAPAVSSCHRARWSTVTRCITRPLLRMHRSRDQQESIIDPWLAPDLVGGRPYAAHRVDAHLRDMYRRTTSEDGKLRHG